MPLDCDDDGVDGAEPLGAVTEFAAYFKSQNCCMQVRKEAGDFVLRSYDRVYKRARGVDLKSYIKLYKDNSTDLKASKAFRAPKSIAYMLIN